MNSVRKALLSVAAVAAMVLIVSLASPRAVHAIAAALVQVVNTPSNAVPAVQAPAASQLYRHYCYTSFQGGVEVTCPFPNVPAGRTLFIETLSVQTWSDVGSDPWEVGLYDQADITGFRFLFVPMERQPATDVSLFEGTLTVRATYTGGAGAATPTCYARLTKPSIQGAVRCSVFGYLAPTQ